MAGITLTSVAKKFGDDIVLDEINLQIDEGEFVALLGPSGCGKTTLLRLIAGFEMPSRGSIDIDGARVAEAGSANFIPPEQRNLGIVFQSYALWPHMDVARNVGYPLEVRGMNKAQVAKQVKEALNVVDMDGFGARNPSELSGGQRQRVALARCLVMEPKAVLFDEPLANLDVHLRASMQRAFAAFHTRTNATMIYVTHDQSEAMSMADRIAVMKDGKILQLAAPEEIYNAPTHPHVARFVGKGVVQKADKVILQDVNKAVVEIADAKVTVQLPSDYRADGAYSISIRPENVKLDIDGDLEMRVTNCTYLGERFILTLTSDALPKLMAYSAFRAKQGDVVKLRILKAWLIADYDFAIS